MDVEIVFRFMKSEQLAVLATLGEGQQPEAAPVGFAVTPKLEIIFDTAKSVRKYPNMKRNPRVAWVIECTTETTMQYEGIAQELEGEETAKYKKTYFATFPDGPARENWRDCVLCGAAELGEFCDYGPAKRKIEEMNFGRA